MNRYSRDAKLCGTCGHWNGDRVPSCSSTCVDVRNQDGKCYATFDVGVARKAEALCGQYVKWSVLK